MVCVCEREREATHVPHINRRDLITKIFSHEDRRLWLARHDLCLNELLSQGVRLAEGSDSGDGDGDGNDDCQVHSCPAGSIATHSYPVC